METKRKKNDSNVKRKQGGLITMPFIFGNEVGEKLAVVGFSTNMISYLTGQLHLPMTKAANTLTNFGGTGALTPLLGAFVADAFAGRFWTITVASVFLQLGMISLTVSAILPNLRPPPCKGGKACEEADSGQLAVLYISLLLSALGSGGYRPCIVSFGADQFDENNAKEKVTTWKFFNWYYFCMGVSILVANTVIVYIQDNVGWGWGLGIPTIAMFVSIVAFVFGYPMYRKMDPAGSPFTRVVQVCAAAFRKRKLGRVSDPGLLYENEVLDAAISVGGKLVHTENMKSENLVKSKRLSGREGDGFEKIGSKFTPLSAVADAFEDLSEAVRADDDLNLKSFCEACSLVSVLFGCLGTAFKFAELEYCSKVSGLKAAAKANSTLNSILDDDVKNGTVRIQGSLSRQLRRVRQGIDLIATLFQNFLSSDDPSLKEAASSAYAKTCAPYHTWAVRTAVSAGMYALPTREQLLLKLNETHGSAEREMRRFIKSSAPIIEYIDKLYTARNISLDW